MECEQPSTDHADKLKELYSRGSHGVQCFFQHAMKRKNNVRETNIDRLLAVLINEEHSNISRKELIECLKKIEEIGCGKFIVGRKGHPSRFLWSTDIALVGKMAINGELNHEFNNDTEASNNLIDDYAQELSRSIRHRYQLRPNLIVEVDLPESLTNKEATRFSDFIKTLPFTNIGVGNEK